MDRLSIVNGSTSLGERLRRLRQVMGWSQNEVARKCGWHNNGQARISYYERGRSPSLADVEMLAQVFNVTAQSLLFGGDAQGKVQIRRLPVVAWEQLRMRQPTDKKIRKSGKVKEYLSVPSDPRYGPTVYALRVNDNKHAPAIARGDMLIVDPARLPRVGQYIVAGLNTKAAKKPALCRWNEKSQGDERLVIYGTVISKITNY